jgi:hypothetical protein
MIYIKFCSLFDALKAEISTANRRISQSTLQPIEHNRAMIRLEQPLLRLLAWRLRS